jgi:hypothetical protein
VTGDIKIKGYISKYRVVMTQQVFEKNINDLLAAIADCLNKQLVLPSLLLLYAGIDIMAWLNRPESRADVERTDFIGWSENYLLPGSGLVCNALDLYAARCALLHSFSAESQLSRKGNAKQIFYAWGSARVGDLQRLVDIVGTHSAVAVHVDDLLKAFRIGVEHFKNVLSHDPQHATLIYQRANKFFSNVQTVGANEREKIE